MCSVAAVDDDTNIIVGIVFCKQTAAIPVQSIIYTHEKRKIAQPIKRWANDTNEQQRKQWKRDHILELEAYSVLFKYSSLSLFPSLSIYISQVAAKELYVYIHIFHFTCIYNMYTNQNVSTRGYVVKMCIFIISARNFQDQYQQQQHSLKS